MWQGGIAQFSGTKFSLAHIAPATRDLVGGFAVALLAGGKTYLPNIHSRAKLGDVRGITVLCCYGVMLLGEREESRDRDGERYNCEREREKRTETETERDTTVNVRL